MELVMAIAGIILIVKFSTVLNAIASMFKAKSEVVAEQVVAECVEQRTDNFENFQKRMEGKSIYTHEEIFKAFKVD